MNKHILVPINFTNISEIGLATALPIAHKIGAKITLLHVVEDVNSSVFRADVDYVAKSNSEDEHSHYMSELIRRRGRQLLDFATTINAGEMRIDTALRFGSFEDAMDNYVEENQVDLIVMGTSGETSISEIFVGSHASQTIRASGIPVLAAKDYYLTTGLEKILLLVDSDEYDEKSVTLLKKILDLLHLQVTVGHVKEDEYENAHFIRNLLFSFEEEYGIKVDKVTVIPHGDKVEEIQKYVDENNISLVATVSKGHFGFIRLFQTSTTEKLINELDRPVLTVVE